MEKVTCLVWAPAGVGADSWRDSLVSDAHSLQALGATEITVHVTDGDVARGHALNLGPESPAGMVSWWTEESTDPRPLAWAAQRSSRVAAYLVVESRPLVPSGPLRPAGRSPGFVTVACIAPRHDFTLDEFRARWFGPHRTVAIETQSTTGYVRHEVVRALTDDAPRWAGIVEETFPIDALDDPAVFFDAVGDHERQADHERRMFESVAAFLDLAAVERHPMSEYRLG